MSLWRGAQDGDEERLSGLSVNIAQKNAWSLRDEVGLRLSEVWNKSYAFLCSGDRCQRGRADVEGISTAVRGQRHTHTLFANAKREPLRLGEGNDSCRKRQIEPHVRALKGMHFSRRYTQHKSQSTKRTAVVLPEAIFFQCY